MRLEPGTQLGARTRARAGFDVHAGVTVSPSDLVPCHGVFAANSRWRERVVEHHRGVA